MPAGNLKQLADALLTAATTALDLTEAGAPSRRFVSHALPAYDCPDQLAVYISSITRQPTGPLGAPPTPGGGGASSPAPARMNMVALRVVSLRCYPVIDDVDHMPSPTVIDAAAGVLCEDAWVLWCYLQRHAPSLLTDQPGCRSCTIGDLNPVPASGGSAGWQLDLSIHVDGYDPAS